MALELGKAAVLAHVAPPVATVVLAGVLTYWVYRRRRDVRGAGTFLFVLVTAGIVWQVLVVIHVLSTTPVVLEATVVAEKWVGWVATMAFVVFVSQYTAAGFHRRRVVQGAIALLLGGYLVLWATNPWFEGLFVANTTVSEPFVYSYMVRTPVYLGLMAVGYGLLLSAYYLVVAYLLAARDGARTRVIFLTLGTVLCGVFHLLSVAGFGPIQGFNYAAYAGFPFILFTSVSIFRLGLLDIIPVARKTLVESLTDPVIVVDRDHRVADFNRAAADLWPALSRRTGDRFSAVCPELAELVTFPSDEETLTDEVTLSGPDGPCHYSVRVSPVSKPHSPGLVGYSILLRDVTELETSRRELQSRNERLDRVASTVSHDLRNPLHLGSGYTGLLAEELAARDQEDLLEHVERVETAHDRMDAIIDDVLTIAREGQSSGDPQAVDLAAVAWDAWAAVDTGAATLEVEGSDTLWADPDRLQTILENLFRNSVEHSSTSRADAVDSPASDGGHRSLTVTIGTCPETDTEGSALGFSVADDGPGIPPDARDDVFEYGFTTSDDGTGIGLATVATMAQSHGWTVSLDDEYDDGARFVFAGVLTPPSDPTDPEAEPV